MGQVKLSDGRWFAPAYGWTRADYEAALLRATPAPPMKKADLGYKMVDDHPSCGLPALLEAIGPKVAWQRDALCREYPTVDFFDDHDQDEAKDVCSRCLVRVECRAAGEREVGVWGGSTSRERARLRRANVA